MNNKTHSYIMIFIALLLPNIVWAQKSLSLQESRDLALEFNKSLKIAAQQKQEAIAEKKEAFTNYLPNIDASGTASYMPTLDDMTIPGFQLPTDASGTTESNAYFPGMTLNTEKLSILQGSVTVKQAIYAGGQVRLANKMAKKGVEIQEQAYQLEEAEVIYNTDDAYWNLAALKEKVKLAESYVQMLDSLELQMSDMYDLGLKPKSEKLKVTVQKNDAELNLLRAKNGFRLMQMNLCQVIGLPLNTEIIITDKADVNPKLPDFSDGSQQALSQRQELKMLEGQKDVYSYQKKMVNAEYLPQLGAQISYDKYKLSNDLYDDASVTVGGQLSIPVFHWFEKKHKKSAAQARLQQADLNLSNSQELIQLEVQQITIQLQEGYEYILLSQKNKAEAQESLEETEASFEVGLNTTTDLLNAQASWQDAVAQEIEALTQFEILKTKYKKVIGLL